MSSSSSCPPTYSNWMMTTKYSVVDGSIAYVSPIVREHDPEHHIYMETPRTPKNLTGTVPHAIPRGHVAPLQNETAYLRQHQRTASPFGHMERPSPVQMSPQEKMEESGSEYLPICDLLFNIVSLIIYFGGVIFEWITIYVLFREGNQWYIPMIACVLLASFLSQVLSVRWFVRRDAEEISDVNWSSPGNLGILMTHALQSGIYWRYLRLFVPVNFLTVKHEVGTLCILRMVHAFTDSAPMLLIQVFMMLEKDSAAGVSRLMVTSSTFSLLNLCWALASYSKNARKKNIHKLVLTWLGVIFQFLWRLGMVSSRVVSLTVYGIVYHEFVFLVIFLHWFSMVLWLLSPPSNLFSEQNISSCKRFFYSLLVGWVYIFCYINLEETNDPRQKMMAFYATMFLENSLLTSISLSQGSPRLWFSKTSVLIVWGGFTLGLSAMILYYKFFHIRYIKLSLDPPSPIDHLPPLDGVLPPQAPQPKAPCPSSRDSLQPSSDAIPGLSSSVMTGIPGVFNCRLNPALKRKKKMPSSFVPRPPETASPTSVPTLPSHPTSATTGHMSSLMAAMLSHPNAHLNTP